MRPIITHLGLGDGILQAGAFVVLCERYGEIAVPCYEQYETSTRSFFAAYPQISVYTLQHRFGFDWGSPPEWHWKKRIKEFGLAGEPLRAGVYAGGIDEDFSASFYRQLGVPYAARWERCPLREAATQVEQLSLSQWPTERKIFLHDDPIRGFVIRRFINRGQAFHPDNDTSQSILRYIDLIEEAQEIHVIDSAFFHLVNSFKPKAKLFLHQYPRWPRRINFRYQSILDWRYVPY
jgi:hypothetical protein